MCTLSEYFAREGTRQSEFAERLGVSQATVSRLIRRSAMPSLELAVRIERLTGGAVPANIWVPPACDAPANANEAQP